MHNIEGFACKQQNIVIPSLFLGMYQITDYQQVLTVFNAVFGNDYMEIGLDTAVLYRNEDVIGRALKALGIPRDRIFLLSKVWDDQGGDYPVKSLEESLRLLQTDYLDLFVLHWPCKGYYEESWRKMEQIYTSGKARAVGVSNFKEAHLDRLRASSALVPAVNQIELHPYFTRESLVGRCGELGVIPQAWSPFMRGGDVLRDAAITKIAAVHGKSPAQVIVRWNLQRGASIVAKSSSPQRIRENWDVFNFSLTSAEMAVISALDKGLETGTDPDSVDW